MEYPTVIIGVDPGINGAIAVITVDLRFVAVFDMPTEAIGTTKRRVSVNQLAHALAGITSKHAVTKACLEKVNSMPREGVASAFRFGDSVGAVRGVLAGFGIACEEVPPAKWKRYHNLLGKTKDQSRTLAQSIFPDCEDLTRKKDSDRAEALLIAARGARLLTREG